jgi:hypothetical protein
MPVPWLRILDAAIGLTDMARRARGGVAQPEAERLPAQGALGNLEARLAGVVVAALKEAFDRDSHRLNLEREQIEAERRRAERALRLELLRQAADRELGRLRLLAGTAVASWLGTLLLAGRAAGGTMAGRALLGCGWAMLLAALAAAFTAQSKLSDAVRRVDPDGVGADSLPSGGAAAAAPWLIVAGLALVAASVLVL